MESVHCRRHPPYKNQRVRDAQLHSWFYHHSEANCSLILPTSPFLPWFNWTWFIFELTSFNPFPTKKANPLWVTSSAAHHPGSVTEREGRCGSLSPNPGWWWGVNTADAVLNYKLELLFWLSAVVLIHIRAMLSELHANTLLVNTRRSGYCLKPLPRGLKVAEMKIYIMNWYLLHSDDGIFWFLPSNPLICKYS